MIRVFISIHRDLNTKLIMVEHLFPNLVTNSNQSKLFNQLNTLTWLILKGCLATVLCGGWCVVASVIEFT